MPLHRDIHWIGRQWAVTGHGMQLIDQKLKGFFDIEASRLWEEALIETMRGKEWLNVADFDKALEVARKRYKDQPRDVPPLPEEVISPAAHVAPAPPFAQPIVPIEPLPEVATPVHSAKPAEPPPQEPDMIELAKPASGKFDMRFLGYAKFIRPWRVRMRK
jgi:hypothetical protein